MNKPQNQIPFKCRYFRLANRSKGATTKNDQDMHNIV